MSVGDRLTLNGQSFTVAGIAVTAAVAPYPNICYTAAVHRATWQATAAYRPADVGLVWITEAAATSHGLAAGTAGHLRAEPEAPRPGPRRRHSSTATSPTDGGPPSAPRRTAHRAGPHFNTWQDHRPPRAGLLVKTSSRSWCPGPLLAVPAGGGQRGGTGRGPDGRAHPAGRAAQGRGQHAGPGGRRAAGREPGRWPWRRRRPGWSRLGGRPADHQSRVPGWSAPRARRRSPRLTVVAVTVAVALAVALASTLVPAIRAARSSTVSALADSARPPRRRGRADRGCPRRLPVPLLLGLRMAARRPRRALLSAASIAVTSAGIVAVLAFRATVRPDGRTGGPARSADHPWSAGTTQMLLVITIVLVALAALNAICTAWATVLDARRPAALTARARRVLAAGQRRAGWPRRCCPRCRAPSLGVPLGIVLFRAGGAGTRPPRPRRCGWPPRCSEPSSPWPGSPPSRP